MDDKEEGMNVIEGSGLGKESSSSNSDEKIASSSTEKDAVDERNDDKKETMDESKNSSTGTDWISQGISSLWSVWNDASSSSGGGAESNNEREMEKNSMEETMGLSGLKISNEQAEQAWKFIEDGAEMFKKQSEAFMSQASKVVSEFDAEKLQNDAKLFISDANRVLTNAGDGKSGDDIDSSLLLAPWETLSEQDSKYAEKLREELIKLTVDCVYSKEHRNRYFLKGMESMKLDEFVINTENIKKIKGAINHDSNLSRLYAGLVPKYIRDERVFWNRYFYHVDRILRELVRNDGKTKQENRVEHPSDMNSESNASNVKSNPQTVANESSNRDSKRDWDKEIDEIFD